MGLTASGTEGTLWGNVLHLDRGGDFTVYSLVKINALILKINLLMVKITKQ